MKIAPEIKELSGYRETRDFPSHRTGRSEKKVFTFSLPLSQVSDLLPIPEPDKPFEDNRAISEVKAKKFGEYWLGNPFAWAVPPLLLDSPSDFAFDAEVRVSNSQIELGYLHLPNNSEGLLRILDGQHRIRGWYLIQKKLTKDRLRASEILQQQKRSGNQVEIQAAQKALKDVEDQLTRLSKESVTIELISGVTKKEHRDFFVTINTNQMGVNKSETVRLDTAGLSALISKELMESHPLLMERIEDRLPSAKGSSRFFISLANLNEIVRHIMYSIKGRNTDSKQTNQVRATELATEFFDILLRNVPEYQQLQNGELLPKDLRKKSLWNSPTMLRGLAGAYFNLVVAGNKGDIGWNKMVEITQDLLPNPNGLIMFENLVKNLDENVMALVINKDNKLTIKNGNWFVTNLVQEAPSAALSSKKQGLTGLSDLLSKWAVTGQVFNPERND